MKVDVHSREGVDVHSREGVQQMMEEEQHPRGAQKQRTETQALGGLVRTWRHASESTVGGARGRSRKEETLSRDMRTKWLKRLKLSGESSE